jgi:hypothetical protein
MNEAEDEPVVRKIYEKKSRDEDEAKSATVQERGDVRIY